MPIDQELYDRPADRGDVAGVAIIASVGLRSAMRAIAALQSGRPVSPEDLTKIAQAADTLETRFDHLSGWRNDE